MPHLSFITSQLERLSNLHLPGILVLTNAFISALAWYLALNKHIYTECNSSSATVIAGGHLLYSWWKRGNAILVLYCRLCLHHNPVDVVSRDTGVLIILLARLDIDDVIVIQHQPGKPDRIITIQQVMQCIRTDICGVLLSLHALTACDTWSFPNKCCLGPDISHRCGTPRSLTSRIRHFIPLAFMNPPCTSDIENLGYLLCMHKNCTSSVQVIISYNPRPQTHCALGALVN